MVAYHRCSGSFSALHRVPTIDVCRPAVDLDEARKRLNMAELATSRRSVTQQSGLPLTKAGPSCCATESNRRHSWANPRQGSRLPPRSPTRNSEEPAKASGDRPVEHARSSALRCRVGYARPHGRPGIEYRAQAESGRGRRRAGPAGRTVEVLAGLVFGHPSLNGSGGLGRQIGDTTTHAWSISLGPARSCSPRRSSAESQPARSTGGLRSCRLRAS
jgi:hypothetical protein